MRCLTRILIVLAVVATAGRESRAGEPDAAELAALIDRHVETRLEAERVRPADPADDAEFLRRVYLDLHGVIPTAEQAARFLTDTDPKRRDKLIDALLASPRYGEYLADVWQGYLISPLADDQRVRADRFRQWLAERFNTKTLGPDRHRPADRHREDGGEPGGHLPDRGPAPAHRPGPDRPHLPLLPGDPAELRPVPRPSVRQVDAAGLLGRWRRSSPRSRPRASRSRSTRSA